MESRPRRAEFGRRLAQLREQAGLSQRALAQKSYLHHTQITRLENGSRSPTGNVAQVLGEKLGAADELSDLGRSVQAEDKEIIAARRAARGPLDRPDPPAHRAVRVLPPDRGGLVGRGAEFDRLDRFLSAAGDRPGAARVCLVTGMPGIGKTSLAVAAAHRFGDRFADGCLFVDLCGFSATGANAGPEDEPVSAADALALLLNGLGVVSDALPGTSAGRANLLRALTADRRLLIVLDNAASADQVRLLLPSASGCRVLVTSRNRLAALDDADVVALAPLAETAGIELFHGISGLADARADSAVPGIVALCAGHPMAIRILAARCRADAGLAPAALAATLAAAGPAVEGLEDGERSVVRAFDLSFWLLAPEQRRLLALLGLYPPFPIEVHTAAMLAGQAVPVVERLLEQLFSVSLVEVRGPGRYRMHDLMAQYAGRMAESVLTPAQRREAVHRLLDSSLLTCVDADSVITPHRYRPPSAAAHVGPASRRAFTDYAAARSWLDESAAPLTALCETAFEHGFDEHCWQLAYALREVFFLGKHWAQWDRSHRFALAAARRAGDHRAEAMTLNNIGLLRCQQGDYPTAHTVLLEAIGIWQAANDRYGEFTARSHRAWLLHCLGRYPEALAEQRAALEFHQGVGARRNMAIVERDMAATEIELGRTGEAIAHLRHAAEEFEALGLRADSAMAFNGLGEASVRTGDLESAELYHRDAVKAALTARSGFELARAHAGFGRTARLTGDRDRAVHQLGWAARLYLGVGATREADLARAAQEATARTEPAAPRDIPGPRPESEARR